MVDHVTDGSVYLTGCQRRHQVETNVDAFAVVSSQTCILQHCLNLCFRQDSTCIADLLASQIFCFCDAAVFQGNDNVHGFLCHRTDGNDGHIFLTGSHDGILHVVHAGIRFASSRQGNAVIGVGRELDHQIQTFFCKIAFFNGIIQEGVYRIGVPVQHNGKILQLGFVASGFGCGVCGFSTSAGCHAKYHGCCHEHCKQFLFHHLDLLSPFDKTIFQDGNDPNGKHSRYGQQHHRRENACAVQLRHHAAAEISETRLRAEPFADRSADDRHRDCHLYS